MPHPSARSRRWARRRPGGAAGRCSGREERSFAGVAHKLGHAGKACAQEHAVLGPKEQHLLGRRLLGRRAVRLLLLWRRHAAKRTSRLHADVPFGKYLTRATRLHPPAVRTSMTKKPAAPERCCQIPSARQALQLVNPQAHLVLGAPLATRRRRLRAIRIPIRHRRCRLLLQLLLPRLPATLLLQSENPEWLSRFALHNASGATVIAINLATTEHRPHTEKRRCEAAGSVAADDCPGGESMSSNGMLNKGKPHSRRGGRC